MIDYSESLIKLDAMRHQYQKSVLKGQFDVAADVAVDMQIAVVNLQEWAKYKWNCWCEAAKDVDDYSIPENWKCPEFLLN